MLPEIIGPHLEQQKALIPVLAREDGPLLILGEEGVGKSLYARHIHIVAEGPRSILPVVNLATASTRNGWFSLLGSDFERMTSTRRSVLEHEGIILIKHIGAAPHSIQDQLARALQTGEFIRPGAVRKASVRCRPIFTLRIKGEERHSPNLLSANMFRYLATARRVTIPPLRERPGDIIAIARGMLGRDLTEDLQKLLLADPWPRNVLELKVYILLLRPFTGRNGPLESCLHQVRAILHRIEEGSGVSLRDSILSIESLIASYALDCSGGHKTRAAELLGVTRTALRRRIESARRPS